VKLLRLLLEPCGGRAVVGAAAGGAEGGAEEYQDRQRAGDPSV
jgi:hypothetical protein